VDVWYLKISNVINSVNLCIEVKLLVIVPLCTFHLVNEEVSESCCLHSLAECYCASTHFSVIQFQGSGKGTV